MATYLVTAAEDGYDNVGVWVGGGANVTFPGDGTKSAGFRFTALPARSATNIKGQPLYQASTIITEMSFSVYRVLAGDPGTWSVYVVPSATPAAYSTSALPRTRSELLVGTLVVDGSNGYQTVTLNVGLMAPYLRGPGFRGNVALSLTWTSTGTASITFMEGGGASFAAYLTTTELPEVTGLQGPWRAQGRVDRCPVCGGLSTRDKWMRDGYRKIYVCKRCWDPDDPVGKRRPRPERPGVNEG